jgi:hypothetical protein
MKKLLGSALALTLAWSPAFAFQAASAPPAPHPETATHGPATAPLPDANPAVWVVRDADTNIYLFGTIHILDTRPWFNDEVRRSFESASELVMEVNVPEDLSSVQQVMLRYATDPQHRQLTQRLSAADQRRLAAALAPMHAAPAAFDRFKPWFVAMVLQVAQAGRQLGLESANGPETILGQAARARHMPIGELEGFEMQLRMFDTMSDADQLALLHETLRDLDRGTSRLRPLLEAWSRGDAARIARLIAPERGDNPRLRRMLFTDRNRNWTRWIQDRLQRPGTVFIAVGAAHLAGPGSVIEDLRAAGIRVQRVPHVVAP